MAYNINKPALLALIAFCASTREDLARVYFQNGAAYATDGHCLLRLKIAGCSGDAVSISRTEAEQLAKYLGKDCAISISRNQNGSVIAHATSRGHASSTAIADTSHQAPPFEQLLTASVSDEPSQGVALSPVYLGRLGLLGGLLAGSEEGLHVHTTGQENAVYFFGQSPGFEVTAVIMPMRLATDGAYVQAAPTVEQPSPVSFDPTKIGSPEPIGTATVIETTGEPIPESKREPKSATRHRAPRKVEPTAEEMIARFGSVKNYYRANRAA